MLNRIGRGLAAGAVAVGRALPILIVDVTGLAAVGLISYGAWLIVPAAGFIVGGTLLLAGAILASLRATKSAGER